MIFENLNKNFQSGCNPSQNFYNFSIILNFLRFHWFLILQSFANFIWSTCRNPSKNSAINFTFKLSQFIVINLLYYIFLHKISKQVATFLTVCKHGNKYWLIDSMCLNMRKYSPELHFSSLHLVVCWRPRGFV